MGSRRQYSQGLKFSIHIQVWSKVSHLGWGLDVNQNSQSPPALTRRTSPGMATRWAWPWPREQEHRASPRHSWQVETWCQPAASMCAGWSEPPEPHPRLQLPPLYPGPSCQAGSSPAQQARSNPGSWPGEGPGTAPAVSHRMLPAWLRDVPSHYRQLLPRTLRVEQY